MDPVLALFFGGFALSAAAARTGIDSWMAHGALKLSRGKPLLLALWVTAATAAMSMWMSNIAAAAMMVAGLRPLFVGTTGHESERRVMLLSVALGANFGGMATPLGTGPNALALAAVSRAHDIDFFRWMMFGVPLAATMALFGIALVLFHHRPAGALRVSQPRVQLDGKASRVMFLFFLTVALWLTEPLHGVPAPAVALLAAAALFGFGLLERKDLHAIDYSTLFLIAGGLLLGHVLDNSGAVLALARQIPADIPPWAMRMGWVLASAVLSALMSNTATAAALIPLAQTLDASPATPILIAMGASLGIPFVISTPPNALVSGEGLPSRALLVIGLPLMVGGVALVALTGPAVLAWAGLR